MNCPRCHAPIPADGPAGMCPKCLLSVGLGEPEVVLTAAGEPAPPPPTPAELQPHFPQLEILRLVGRGGMGAVYEARQKGLQRSVALKILAAPTRADASFEERFVREAQALARLSHENIVAVYDAGRAGPHFFLTMEYVDGPNLRQAERAGHIEPAQALALVVQICAALDYAHKNGIVHRDIKPENVLLTRDGKVKIVDFGLAKVLDRAARGLSLTRMSQTMGTPHYMAPEQIERPKDVDHRADIYSLGVVFYELLTGELPLGRFPLPSQKVTLDVRLDEIVIRTLEKEPDRRYQFAGEVRTAVQDVATTPPPVARAGRARVATQPWSARRWAAVIALAVGLLLLLGFGLVSFLLSWPRPPAYDPASDPALGRALAPTSGATLLPLPPLTPDLESQIASAIRTAESSTPNAPRASVLVQLAPELQRASSSATRLAALGYVFARGDARDAADPVSRYDALEARSVEPLGLEEGEIAALRLAPNATSVHELREDLRRRIVGQVGTTLFSREELDRLLIDRMPFDSGPVEIRISRRDSGWYVERRTKSGVSAETFPELPPRYGRLVDRFFEHVPPLEDPDSAPLTARGAQAGAFVPRPVGLSTQHALAWSDAQSILAEHGASLVERYRALEAQHVVSVERIGPGQTVRVRLQGFAAERAVLSAELWTILTHAMQQDELVRAMQLDFDRAVLPYGDQAFDVTIARDATGWRVTERSDDGHFDGTFTTSELPARVLRVLKLAESVAPALK